jgi:hypothetical protein
VAILLEYRAGESAASDDEDALVVLFEFVDQRDEIAVSAHDREGIDVIVGEGHFEGVEGQVDVSAVFIAARRRIALHHLHRVFGKGAGGRFLSAPIRIRELGDDFAALFERVQHGRDIEFAVECGLDADFDVIEIDEDGDLQFLFHLHSFWQTRCGGGPVWPHAAPRSP